MGRAAPAPAGGAAAPDRSEPSGTGAVAQYLREAILLEISRLKDVMLERVHDGEKEVHSMLRPAQRWSLSRFKLVLLAAFTAHLLIYWHIAGSVIQNGEASIHLGVTYLIVVFPVAVGVSVVALTFPSSHRQLKDFKADAIERLGKSMDGMRAKAETLRAERDTRVAALSSSFRKVMSRHSEQLQRAVQAHLQTIQENLQSTWGHFRNCLHVMHTALGRVSLEAPAWLTVDGLIDGLQRRIERTEPDSEGRLLQCSLPPDRLPQGGGDAAARSEYVLPATSFVALARELDARSRRPSSSAGSFFVLSDASSRLMFTVQLEKLQIEATTATLLRALDAAVQGLAIEQQRRIAEATFALSEVEMSALGTWKCNGYKWRVGYWAQKERMCLLAANVALILLSLFMGAHGCTEQTCRFAVPLVLMLHLTATLSMVAVALSSKGIYELRLQMKDVVVREATSYAGHVLFVLEQLPGDADFMQAMEDVSEEDEDRAFERCTAVVEMWKERVRAFEAIVHTLHLMLTHAAINSDAVGEGRTAAQALRSEATDLFLPEELSRARPHLLPITLCPPGHEVAPADSPFQPILSAPPGRF